MTDDEKENARRRVVSPLNMMLALKQAELVVSKLIIELAQHDMDAEDVFNTVEDALSNLDDSIHVAVGNMYWQAWSKGELRTRHDFDKWRNHVLVKRRLAKQKERNTK